MKTRADTSTTTKTNSVLYRLALQSDFKKIDLPPLDVWNRLESSAMNLSARIPIRIRKKGLLFDSKTQLMWRKCILSPKGYLIVYVQEEVLRGYALDLTLAKKIKWTGLTSKYQKKKGIDSACEVKIKWSAGSLTLFLSAERMPEWCQMLMSCSGTTIDATPTSQPINEAAKRQDQPQEMSMEEKHSDEGHRQREDWEFWDEWNDCATIFPPTETTNWEDEPPLPPCEEGEDAHSDDMTFRPIADEKTEEDALITCFDSCVDLPIDIKQQQEGDAIDDDALTLEACTLIRLDEQDLRTVSDSLEQQMQRSKFDVTPPVFLFLPGVSIVRIDAVQLALLGQKIRMFQQDDVE